MSKKVSVSQDGKSKVEVSPSKSGKVSVSQDLQKKVNVNDSKVINISEISGTFTDSIVSEIDVSNTDTGIGQAIGRTYDSGTKVDDIVSDILKKNTVTIDLDIRLKDISNFLGPPAQEFTPFFKEKKYVSQRVFLISAFRLTIADEHNLLDDDEPIVFKCEQLDEEISIIPSDLGITSWSQVIPGFVVDSTASGDIGTFLGDRFRWSDDVDRRRSTQLTILPRNFLDFTDDMASDDVEIIRPFDFKVSAKQRAGSVVTDVESNVCSVKICKIAGLITQLGFKDHPIPNHAQGYGGPTGLVKGHGFGETKLILDYDTSEEALFQTQNPLALYNLDQKIVEDADEIEVDFIMPFNSDVKISPAFSIENERYLHHYLYIPYPYFIDLQDKTSIRKDGLNIADAWVSWQAIREINLFTGLTAEETDPDYPFMTKQDLMSTETLPTDVNEQYITLSGPVTGPGGFYVNSVLEDSELYLNPHDLSVEIEYLQNVSEYENPAAIHPFSLSALDNNIRTNGSRYWYGGRMPYRNYASKQSESYSSGEIITVKLKKLREPIAQFDVELNVRDHVPTSDRHEAFYRNRFLVSNDVIVENGFNGFGQDDNELLKIKLHNLDNFGALSVTAENKNIRLIRSSDVVISSNQEFTRQILTDNGGIIGSNVDYSIDNNVADISIDTSVSALGFIGKSDNTLVIQSNRSHGVIKYSFTQGAPSNDVEHNEDTLYGHAKYTGDGYYPEFGNLGPRDAKIICRRRSFMFISNMNIRASVSNGLDGLDWEVPGSNYANMDGDIVSSDPEDGTGHSNRFMHYLISSSSSGTDSVLSTSDKIVDVEGHTLSFYNLGILGNDGTDDDAAIHRIEFRHVVDADLEKVSYNDIEESYVDNRFYWHKLRNKTSFRKVPHFSGATNIQKYPGFLAEKNALTMETKQITTPSGSTGLVIPVGYQHWDRSVATTSPNAFLYRAIPIEMSRNTLLSGWSIYTNIDGESVPTQAAYRSTSKDVVSLQSNEGINGYKNFDGFDWTRAHDEMILDPADNAPMTFTVTNQYGKNQEYVLFQSVNNLDNSSSTGSFGLLIDKRGPI